MPPTRRDVLESAAAAGLATAAAGAVTRAIAQPAAASSVPALRRYIDELPPESKGWFAGLRDPHIGEALSLIHGRPGEHWTLDRFARELYMSRSAFAERFAAYVGEPPMRYLARWRMQLALRMLESPNATIAQVADRVGYHSEPAFIRAFKKHLNISPGQWRESHLP